MYLIELYKTELMKKTKEQQYNDKMDQIFERSIILKAKHKDHNDRVKAINLLDDTIAWLDNNSGNSQTEDQQNEVMKAIKLLTNYINK